ncbi:MAG: hypothetical protein HYV76_00030 [Candidatus Vogelbacteria bacterium]|nr:hypothetical protein [Candidatus Vogelbacteria bacterium]
MKSLIIGLVTLMAIFGGSLSALAETGSTTTEQLDYLNKIRTIRESIRDERREAFREIEERRRRLLEERLTLATSSSADFKEAREELRDERRVVIASTTVAIKNWIDEKRQENIRRFGAIMIQRFAAVLTRIDRFIERLEDSGRLTDEAKPKLDETKNLIKDSRDKLATLPTEIDNILASSTPKTAFGDIRQAVSQVRDSIKTAHAKLIEVIRLIEGVGPVNDRNTATSTATTTTTNQ